MPQGQSQVAGGVAAVTVVTFQGLADLRDPEGAFTLMQGQISHGARSLGPARPDGGGPRSRPRRRTPRGRSHPPTPQPSARGFMTHPDVDGNMIVASRPATPRLCGCI